MSPKSSAKKLSRRQWLATGLAGGVTVISGASLFYTLRRYGKSAATVILKAGDYSTDLRGLLLSGLKELGLGRDQVKAKRILLKPNLVEVDRSAPQVNTHPLLVRAAADAFMYLGAASVVVAEGSGHCLDSILVFECSGLREALAGGGFKFIDLNQQNPLLVEKSVNFSKLPFLAFPDIFREVDWIVSMPKMKTHHWAGVTLSMKNLFGVMPGSYYGWPKNVLHQAGINECVADIALTLKPQLAIVDGIVGMEGDGPIMGDPVKSGVLVLGQILPVVDATCARIMGINPERVPALRFAQAAGYSIAANDIAQLGESIASTQKPFKLLPQIPAQKDLRL
jgi:uncharacterized protein (DUF362 family)